LLTEKQGDYCPFHIALIVVGYNTRVEWIEAAEGQVETDTILSQNLIIPSHRMSHLLVMEK